MEKITIPKAYIFSFRPVEGGVELDLQDAETREVFFTAPEVYENEVEALNKINVWIENNRLHTWDSLRANRNQRLSQSDWTQLADAPLTQEQKNAWAAYRQALRDVPSSASTPEEVVWPPTPV
jgi:hypothetical protein